MRRRISSISACCERFSGFPGSPGHGVPDLDVMPARLQPLRRRRLDQREKQVGFGILTATPSDLKIDVPRRDAPPSVHGPQRGRTIKGANSPPKSRSHTAGARRRSPLGAGQQQDVRAVGSDQTEGGRSTRRIRTCGMPASRNSSPSGVNPKRR